MLTYFCLILAFLVALVASVMLAMLKLSAWLERREQDSYYDKYEHVLTFWLSNHGLTNEFLSTNEAIVDGTRVYTRATYTGNGQYRVTIGNFVYTLSADYLNDWRSNMAVIFDNGRNPDNV